MRKLYVTVSDEVYKLLEDYVAFYSGSFVGVSKSSVVNGCLLSFLTSGKHDDVVHPCSTFSLSNKDIENELS